MAFSGMMLTTDGKTLYAKAQQGKPLHFTRVGIGDGLLGNSSMINRTGLISERHSLRIDAIQLSNNGTETAVVVTLTNSNFEEGFYFREIALFAEDPDTHQEKIYLYDNAGTDGEYIPEGSGGVLVNERLKLLIMLESTAQVTFESSGNPLYITAAELNEILKTFTQDLSFEPLIKDALEKKAPADADALALVDSADGNKTKRLLWSGAKEALKAFMDALYAGKTHAHKPSDLGALSQFGPVDITVPLAWTGSGPWEQTVLLAGVTADMELLGMYPAMITDDAARKLQEKAYSCITYAETVAGGIKLTCRDKKPEVAFQAIVKGEV